ncbi:MAG TPA: ATP-binding protein [Anaerolineales bacterium]|nr:ATP-binding protein [Anaerolineales bacterium]
MIPRELILLALDESESLHLMERALLAVNYEVAIARDCEGLEKILEESSPALLLIAEHFSGQNGIELAEKELERFPTLPILLFAEMDTTGTIKAVLKAGLSGYLYPPLHTEDIVNAADRSLARARHLGDWIRREVKRTTSSLEKRARISESERDKLEAIIANIEDGVIVLDQERKILFMNRIAREVFDLSAEAMGRPILHVIQNPDLQAFLLRSTENPVKYHELNFDDGRVLNAQQTVIPHIGTAITIHDITYLKKLDQIKSDFVHTVSHDLRSPLTAVLGYTELIARVGPVNQQQQEFLGRIQASVQSITTLINDLLDLGRLEAGFDTRREAVQLESVLQYSLDMLESLMTQKNLHLEKNIAANLPALRANPIRIRQMLDNLIGNAIKYTPKDGTIRIGIRTEDRQLVLEISDTGPGIPLDEQSRIFEKFYRASNVLEGPKGSGLGLAIVKSIVESHQGRVWVESTLGKGATFIVVLPEYEA